jgi:hypothetical protein
MPSHWEAIAIFVLILFSFIEVIIRGAAILLAIRCMPRGSGLIEYKAKDRAVTNLHFHCGWASLIRGRLTQHWHIVLIFSKHPVMAASFLKLCIIAKLWKAGTPGHHRWPLDPSNARLHAFAWWRCHGVCENVCVVKDWAGCTQGHESHSRPITLAMHPINIISSLIPAVEE